MFPPNRPWKPKLDWDAPAGRVLRKFLDGLPRATKFQITVFGSTPLQLTLDRDFLSGDVDIFSHDDITDLIREVGLGKGQSRVYIERCAESAFVASPTWRERAYSVRIRNVTLTFPHPIDLLVAKLPRLEPKDLHAFRLVRAKTGHPTEVELRRALQRTVDLYRPPFAQERTPFDAVKNTETVWRKLFGRKINVRAEIIEPALRERCRAYGRDAPAHRQRLRRLAGN